MIESPPLSSLSASELATLPVQEKRALLKSLLNLQAGGAKDRIPLSYGQTSLWFIQQLAPKSPAYHFLFAARIRTAVNLEIFRRACRMLVQRHPLLRTRFVLQDNQPMQHVADDLAIDVPLTDASSWTEDELHEQLRQRADRPFDLERGPCLRIDLFQRSPSDFVLALVFHHIIADLWSADVLLQELHQLYDSLQAQQQPGLPPIPADFADFVRWQMVQVHTERGRNSRLYWHQLLAGGPPALDLPTDRPRPPVQTYNGAAWSWPLKAAVVGQARTLAREQGSTPFAVLLAAFQVLLHRLSGQDDVLVGTTVADREQAQWERVVGYFLNQVVFRTRFTADRSFQELLAETREQLHQALEHQAYPFGLLVKHLQPRRDPARPPIFQVMFIWDKPRDLAAAEKTPGLNGQALHLEPMLMEQRGAPFDLVLIIFEMGPKLVASLRYNADLFDAATIERWAGHFNTLLETLVSSPRLPLSEIPILSPVEREQLLVEWNRTEASYPQSTLHQLIEQQVRKTPGAAAISFEKTTLTYDELNRRANQLARHLQNVGVERGSLVAVSLPRSLDLIVSILAIWKAGGAYLFLDATLPAKRRAAMIADSQPTALIAPTAQADLPLLTVPLDTAWVPVQQCNATNRELPVSPEDGAYIIYTSGSTGEPKGTVLRHRGLCNLVQAQRQTFAVEPGERVLQFASFSFDASVFELAMALASGAELVLGCQAALMPGQPLLEFLRDQAITHVTLPPSVLAMLPAEPLPALRTIVVAGEACSAELVDAWAPSPHPSPSEGEGRVRGVPGRRFFNAYGPTETTIWATVAACASDGRAPTIGKPIANHRVYVLDHHLQPVPVGVVGELYLAGPGLALGYLNKPDLTAERFLPNPFDSADEGVMYRTGDRVRWTPTGELEFLGRSDHQVKLRGYRIELEEIQEVLRRCPEVRDAVVVFRPETASLAAYVVPRSAADFSLQAVRAHLRESLPHYMLPAAMVPLETLPLGSTGKVDRARLPAAESVATSPARPETNGAPHTALERTLVQIWSHVLKVEPIGIFDNFFDLGGASTQTVEVATRARDQGIALTPEMLFRHQTIAELAAASSQAARNDAPPACSLVRDASTSAERLAQPGEAKKQSTGAGAVVESIGVFLPERSVSTEQILKNCRNPINFPLERLTGIRTRRMAGDKEFSIDLAAKAVAECLKRSARRPEEIELLICCNISRIDGPLYRLSLEPTTAARIAQRFGLVNAIAFDLTNACAGTFTAILLADAFIRAGIIHRAMIVSGEYVTHLTGTAQQEIESFMDSRLACLTVGDSGAALILERSPRAEVGFQEIELYTLGRYHPLCVAKMPNRPESRGPIMYTDSVASTVVTVKQAVSHALEVLRRKQWNLDKIDALVIHQTSETTLDGAIKEVNRAVGRPVFHRGNTLFNVAERGNTATNTHFLAIWERIQAGKLKAGDRAIFAVSGSGQTVGTALYAFDDLPERIRQNGSPVAPIPGSPTPVAPAAGSPLRHFRCQRRVRIESIGTAVQSGETVAMLRQAGEACLQASARPREEIDLVIHAGVYRSEFIAEPAVASIAAGELAINHDETQCQGRRTLAFDVLNGAGGALTACFLASELMAARKFSRALLLASEVDHNRQFWPENQLGLEETASALVLEPSANASGFAAFAFRTFSELIDAVVSYAGPHEYRGAGVFHHRDPALNENVVACIGATVREFLARESMAIEDVKRVVLPQGRGNLGPQLAAALGIGRERLVTLDGPRDYFTSSLAYSLQKLRQSMQPGAGAPVLIVEVAAGLQVGCALYFA